MQDLQDRIIINSTEFCIQWSIDVDKPVVESCSVDTFQGSCIYWALDLPVKAKIERFIQKRMDEMEREAREEASISSWENRREC